VGQPTFNPARTRLTRGLSEPGWVQPIFEKVDFFSTQPGSNPWWAGLAHGFKPILTSLLRKDFVIVLNFFEISILKAWFYKFMVSARYPRWCDPTKSNCTFKSKSKSKLKHIKRLNNKNYDEEDSNGSPNRWTKILMGLSHYFHGPKKSTRLEEVHQSPVD